jgi:sialic acid synthase SpsE
MKNKLYLIAEIGVNYYDTAKELNISLMDAAKLYCLKAKESGANCAKFQTYKADKLASKLSPAYWDRTKEPCGSQFELFQKFDLFGELEYTELKHYCDQIGIDFISTPFDFDSADYLNKLVSVFKISSSDLNNIPFLNHIAAFGKPVYLSTGASSLEEIRYAVKVLKEGGCPKIVLFHCVLSYPTKDRNANLLRISSLKAAFPDLEIGYSDHTVPDSDMTCLTAAYLLGAHIIEKHFTLNKKLQGNDHYHAMDPKDIAFFVNKIRKVNVLLGSGNVHYQTCESNSRKQARRSLIAARDIPEGTIIKTSDITLKRPGTGIPPHDLERIIGDRAIDFIPKDAILQFSMFKGKKK